MTRSPGSEPQSLGWATLVRIDPCHAPLLGPLRMALGMGTELLAFPAGYQGFNVTAKKLHR